MSESSDAPLELVAVDDPYPGVISTRRNGQPFGHVQGVADAIMVALKLGIDLVVPARMFAEIRDSFPPELPPYIKVR